MYLFKQLIRPKLSLRNNNASQLPSLSQLIGVAARFHATDNALLHADEAAIVELQ